jgi:peptidoglycan/LPS O-acetylase OafA/YrhL
MLDDQFGYYHHFYWRLLFSSLRYLLSTGEWRIGEFLIGFITAVIYANIMWRGAIIEKIPFLSISEESIQRVINLIRSSSLSLFSFWLLFSFILSARANSYFVLFIVHNLVSVIAAILILQITISPNQIIKYFLGSKLIIKAGIVSYGLYIYHYPILKIESWFFTEKVMLDRIIPFQRPLRTVIYLLIEDTLLLILTLSISYVSYKFIERPILKYKANFTRG